MFRAVSASFRSADATWGNAKSPQFFNLHFLIMTQIEKLAQRRDKIANALKHADKSERRELRIRKAFVENQIRLASLFKTQTSISLWEEKK